VNHYVGVLIMSVCISAVFTLITKGTREERILYFLKLMAYMVLGSLLAAWAMYGIPW
jgi:hypothetical protein